MWWREGLIYQVYVRSFADGNGDGHGDLPGLRAQLDYLEWLGVDGLWLTPIHPSPNDDWGYDVSDFVGVHPDYGTIDDLDALVGALAGGAAQSWGLENRSGRMIANDYPLGFKVALHRKDLAIALELARELGAELPVSEFVAQVEDGLIADGYADEDMSAVARAIRARANMER
jgi:hypothetical protein